MELPELPKPPAYESAHDEAPLTDHYSADQMRVYALEAIAAERERCAKLCETLNHGAFGNSSYLNGIQDGSGGCAAAIRAQGSKT